ncbi:MAG: S8 family peptidase [Deinococcales bacterium]
MRFVWRIFIGLSVPLFLVACSGSPEPQLSDQRLVVSVKPQSGDTAESLVARYGGRVLSLESDFAIISTSRRPDASDTSVLSVETNKTLASDDAKLTLEQPGGLHLNGAQVGASNVGMSGWSSWSSGWGTWSSGWGTWSSGQSLPPLPAENRASLGTIRLPQAHAISSRFGRGVTVAVIDTGIDLAHPGFTSLVPANQRWDFVDNDSIPQEVPGLAYGHGTAVAGLIAQVAPDALIMPLRVLGPDGKGDLDNVIAAIDFAISKGAKVINISLGAGQFSEALYLMMQRAKQNQVYIFAAAGNRGRLDSADFPARMTNWSGADEFLFSVGSSSGTTEALSSFTNRGMDVTVIAPGEALTTFAPNRRTLRASGTSFATPLVAGALALALSETNSPSVRAGLGEYLYDTLDKQMVYWDVYSKSEAAWLHGQGRLDIERLLLSLPGFNPSPPRPGRSDLVANGNFERDFVGWLKQGAYIEKNLYSGLLYSGNSAAAIYSRGWISQKMTGLLPNTSYKLQAFVRVRDPYETAVFGVRLGGSGNNTIKQTIKQSLAPQKIELTFVSDSSGEASVLLEKTSGYGPAMLDRVSLYKN